MVVHYFIAKLNKDKPYARPSHHQVFSRDLKLRYRPQLASQSINMKDMSKLIDESHDIADYGARI